MEINKEASKRMIALVAPGVELSHREELLKLSMGRMFDSVVQRMRQCADGQPKHQMYMYSGHDTTIMPLLATLGQDVSTWPAYVSNVVFELWESQTPDGKKQDYVKVLVNGKEVELPDMLPGMLFCVDAPLPIQSLCPVSSLWPAGKAAVLLANDHSMHGNMFIASCSWCYSCNLS